MSTEAAIEIDDYMRSRFPHLDDDGIRELFVAPVTRSPREWRGCDNGHQMRTRADGLICCARCGAL